MTAVLDADCSQMSLTNVLCWTRIQAEAGQNLTTIIKRKEFERRAGNGIFFWGIGNAPNREVGRMAREEREVDVVFSTMKTRPKKSDLSPSGLLVWQTYLDSEGRERSIPEHVLVTSKKDTKRSEKSVHYALICESKKTLELKDYGPFDPTAYRNVSELQRPIGASQVTAVVSRTTDESHEPAYRVNLRAKLALSYWVKLCQPCTLNMDGNFLALKNEIEEHEWIELVSKIRRQAKSNCEIPVRLF